MAITQKVTVYCDNFTVPPMIHAVQNDTGRVVETKFADFTLTAGMTGKLSFIRSDKTHYEVSATLSTVNNTATAELDQALTQAGVTNCQMKITGTDGVVSDFTFMVKVQPDVAGVSQEQDGLSLQEVMDAIDEAATASGTSYDNTTSGLTADDVQEAIDEIDGTLDSLGTEVGGLTDSFSVSLPLASWSSNTQTVSNVKFVASGFTYFVSASPSDILDYGESVIYADNVTTDGSMVFHCVDLPVRDLTVNITKVAVTA